MNLEKLRQAAIEYQKLMKVNREIKELGNGSLARKFGCSGIAISRVSKGIKPMNMDDEDFRIIGLCLKEREKLVRSKNGETRASIAKRYRVRNDLLVQGLEYI